MRTLCHVNPVVQQRLIDAICERAQSKWRGELCYLAPMLLDLVTESHERPVEDLEPAIRALLREHSRVTADPVFFDPRAFDHHVQLLVEELESIRREQVAQGAWSEACVPPQMFG